MRNWLLFFIIVAVLLSCARPSWRRIYSDRNVKTSEPLGYAWLWEEPPAKASTVDFARVTLQVGALLFLGGCIVFSRYIFRPIESKGTKRILNYLGFLALLLLIGYSVSIIFAYKDSGQQKSPTTKPRTISLKELMERK